MKQPIWERPDERRLSYVHNQDRSLFKLLKRSGLVLSRWVSIVLLLASQTQFHKRKIRYRCDTTRTLASTKSTQETKEKLRPGGEDAFKVKIWPHDSTSIKQLVWEPQWKFMSLEKLIFIALIAKISES